MSEWISVKDGLPKENTRVLIYSPIHNKQIVAELRYGSYWYAITARDSAKNFTWKVTHWMPLPEPPKEDDE